MKNKHKNKLTTDSTHNNLSINTDADKNLSCNTKVLDAYHAHLNDMIQHHSKVMQIRVDLRYPADESITPIPQHISDLHYNLKRKFDRETITGGHKVDSRLISVQEQHDSSHPHYHSVILVNANAKKDYYGIAQEVEKQWKQVLKTDQNGLVNYCNKNGKNGIVIDRNKEDFEEKKNQCSHQASYLAKERGKDAQAKGSWLVKGTRLPKKE